MTPDRFTEARRALSTRLITSLVRLFYDLGSWRANDVTRFVQRAVPLVVGTQRTLAALVGVYMATRAAAAVGSTVAPVGIRTDRVVGLRGVDPAQVYRRPFAELYTGLADGKTVTDSLAGAARRLEQVADLDLQQTHAHAAQAAMQALPPRARPTGWRRVLVGPDSCALCVVASTQLYHVKKLNPIHPACDCRVEPFYGKPKNVIEPELLERVHTAVQELTGKADRGARAPDYRQIMTSMVAEHGELGPMLVKPRDSFTGRGDIQAA